MGRLEPPDECNLINVRYTSIWIRLEDAALLVLYTAKQWRPKEVMGQSTELHIEFLDFLL